jgi:hypothetical protein
LPLLTFVKWKTQDGRPTNLWKQLDLFDLQVTQPNVKCCEYIGIAKAHVSFLITGFSLKQYTAYCFATGCDDDLVARENDHLDSSFMPDPIVTTQQDYYEAEPNKDPRVYFLDALYARLEQCRAGWENLVHNLLKYFDDTVSSDLFLLAKYGSTAGFSLQLLAYSPHVGIFLHIN